MARWALKRNLRPASCCSVDVMNGAAGERRKGRSVTALTVKDWPANAVATAVASSSTSTRTRPSVVWTPSSLKSLPVATVVPPSETRAAPKGGGCRGVGEGAVDAPPGGGVEAHPGPLALDDHAGGHALHPSGREPGHDLAPQDRRHLVAVEPVEDPPGLLGVDQAAVEVAPLLDGAGDGLGGDLVEDHALDRDGGREHLEEVPGDGLALAVLVGGEIQLVGVLEQPLEIGHDRLLRGRDHVERLEPVVHVDAEAGPALALVGRRHLVGPPGEVADVADGGLHDEVGARADHRWSAPWPATRR